MAVTPFWREIYTGLGVVGLPSMPRRGREYRPAVSFFVGSAIRRALDVCIIDHQGGSVWVDAYGSTRHRLTDGTLSPPFPPSIISGEFTGLPLRRIPSIRLRMLVDPRKLKQHDS